MNPKLRKFVLGAVVLGALLLVYVTYLRLDPSASHDIEVIEELEKPLAAGRIDVPGGKAGKIAGVGIHSVERTHFLHTDETGRVDRKLGFDELLQSENDQWVITNPYLDLFLTDIKVRVTADRGKVQVKTAFGELEADDAMFSGNVVIRIIPSEPNDPMTVFIYLDDVAFIAEQSLFSTIGAVRFVSRSAQLVGRGMELLYDAPAQRLQLFRIKDLDTLRLRSAAFGSLEEMTRRDEATDANEPTPEGPPTVAAEPPEDAAAPPASEGDVYECIFRRNVTITTPEQVVTARDRLVIGNILWSSSKQDDDQKVEPNEVDTSAPPAEPNLPQPGLFDPNVFEPNDLPYPGPDALDTTASESIALDAIPESLFDIVVTCDGGFVVAPQGSPELADGFDDLLFTSRLESKEPSAAPAVAPNCQTAIAQRIEFDATTTNTTLLGPVTITFVLDPNDLTGRGSRGELMPVTITARDAVRYLPQANRIQLEGNCAVTLRQTEPNYTYAYMLTAPVLALDLMDDPNAAPGSAGIALKLFTASGGPVAVHAQRKAGAELVGWVELQAAVLDYEAANKRFTVLGPGLVSLHNGEDLDVGADPNEFSIGRPCFAFLQDFDALIYSAATNLIVAEAQAQPIVLDYIPQVDGSYDTSGVRAVAGRIEIQLTQTEEERLELALLTASEGITFVDDDNRFDGTTLFYDHAQSLVTVEGDDIQPCYFNGALVDRIEMNLKTGDIRTKIQTPTTLQLTR